MMDQELSISKSIEKTIDYSSAISVDSMDAVYRDVAEARCECGGKFFPTGPVSLKSTVSDKSAVRYKLMFVYCTSCSSEGKRLYALNTASTEFRTEQSRAFSEIPRWGNLVGGNPIDPEIQD
jgi:hypothetical protein